MHSSAFYRSEKISGRSTMTECLAPSSSRGALVSLESCRPRYRAAEESILNTELKHSKSDDLILQSGPLPETPEEPLHRPLSPDLPYESVVPTSSRPKSSYFSDSEPDVSNIGTTRHSKLHNCNHLGLYDSVDPEDSIWDMISEKDFYRFVLFKKHYDKYLRVSLKYEEALNIAYYLEEKYHEIKNERDSLLEARRELERKLETKQLELHEKEEELFLQLERFVRLEEDCEKLRAEKEKFTHWKDRLERERNEAYAQLKLQSTDAERTRRGLERARQEVVHQVTLISAEKDYLERENVELKERLEIERAGAGNCFHDMHLNRRRMTENVVGLEKELSQVKLAARQTATLNSQLQKAMQHLASCRRRKCSVCAYTKASFGEFAGRNDKKLFTCFQAPFNLRNWIRPVPGSVEICDEPEICCEALPIPSPPPSPPPSLRSDFSFMHPHLSYIDDTSTVSESSCDSGRGGESPYNLPPCSCPAFSSDSGFSSELYDSKPSSSTNSGGNSSKHKLERTKWTASFRKLINRVSKRSDPTANSSH